MATATRTMEVEFTAKDVGVGRTTANVRKAIGGVGDQTDKTGGKVRGGFSTMKAAVAGFAGGAAAQLAGNALGAVINFGKESITAASDMQETLSKSRAIFGDQAKSVERWASGGAKNFGLAKSEALAYASSLGDMASQIGFTGKESASFGQDLVQVSADLGSFNNLETGDVLDRISAAMRGEYDSLQAIIPNINAARVEQEALTATGKKAAKELTAQDKALAVQAILHKDGSKAMGDFAKTSGGFANQQKIAAAQVQTLQENLGAFLLPILTQVMGFITTTAIPALIEFAAWAGDNIVPAIRDFGSQLQGILPVIQSLGQFLADNAAVLLPLAGIVLAVVAAIKVWTAVQAALNLVMSLNPIGIVVIAIAALVAGLIFAYQNSETFRKIVNGAFEGVRRGVEIAVGVIVSTVRGIADWLTRTAKIATDFGQGVIKTFVDTQRRVVETITGLTRGVIDGVTTMRDRAIRFVTDLRDKFVRANVALRDGAVRAVIQLRDRVVGFVLSLRDRVVAGVEYLRTRAVITFVRTRDSVVRTVTSMRDRVVAFVTSLRDRAMAFVLSLRDRFIGAVRALRDRAIEAVQGLRERVVARVVALRDTAVRVAGQVRDRVLAPFRSLRDGAVKIFTGIRDTVGRSFSGLLERVKAPLRTVFGWMNRNLISPLNSVTSKFGLNIPSLPKFHSGTSRVGRGRGEVLALLKEDEAVLTGAAADRVGRDTIDRANRGEAMGGPSWFDQFTEFISKPAKLVQEMAENGVKWAVSQVLRAIPNAPTSGVAMADLVPSVFNTMKSKALEWAAGKEDDLAADLGSVAGGSIGSGPWVKPVAAGVGTGYLGYPGHYGVDFPAGTGSPVHAVSNAIVTKAASLTSSYGKHLFLRHADGLVTVYAHMSSLLAGVGKAVKTGEVIGRVGSTGNSTGPHLHFETRVGGGYPGPNPRSVMAARGVRFDAGGMLPPGLSMVMNGTGGPEPVLTGQQWARMGPGGGETNIYLTIQGAVDKEATARQLVTILDDYYRRRGGVRVTTGRNR